MDKAGLRSHAKPADNTERPYLSVKNLTRDFVVRSSGNWIRRNYLRALDGINLDVTLGGILGIIGESGSGKSSLARLMLGLDRPTSGNVLLDGDEAYTLSRQERAKKIQLVFQDPFSALNPHRTIFQILEQALIVDGALSRAGRSDAIHEAIRTVGLPERMLGALPKELSGGQRQRVVISRALLPQAPLIVCDEPTSALDVSIQAQILNLLLDLRARLGLSYVIVSHNLSVIRHMCDDVVVMSRGEIVERGKTAEVFSAPQHPYTEKLLNAELHV